MFGKREQFGSEPVFLCVCGIQFVYSVLISESDGLWEETVPHPGITDPDAVKSAAR